MRVFLDTEFLMGPDGPLFLSSAFLASNGLELYAELPAEEIESLLQLNPNDFVRAQVLPQFGRQKGVPWAELPGELARWLDGLGAEDVDMIYDYGNDYLLVEQLLDAHGQPLRARLHPVNVGYLLADEDGNSAAEAAWQAILFARGLARHHAMADSFALRSRFDTVHPPTLPSQPQIIIVHATVRFIINEFELVHADTDDGELTLSIGKRATGVDWRNLVVGQRLRCVVQTGAGTRVLRADVLP